MQGDHPDPEISGGWGGGGAVAKKIFSAHRAAVCSKIKENGADTKTVPDIRNGDFCMLDIWNSPGLGSLVEEKGKERVPFLPRLPLGSLRSPMRSLVPGYICNRTKLPLQPILKVDRPRIGLGAIAVPLSTCTKSFIRRYSTKSGRTFPRVTGDGWRVTGEG